MGDEISHEMYPQTDCAKVVHIYYISMARIVLVPTHYTSRVIIYIAAPTHPPFHIVRIPTQPTINALYEYMIDGARETRSSITPLHSIPYIYEYIYNINVFLHR